MIGKEHFNSLYEQALLIDSSILETVWLFIRQSFILDFPVHIKTDICYLMWMCRKLAVAEVLFITHIKRLIANNVVTVIKDINPYTQQKTFSRNPADFGIISLMPEDFFVSLSIMYVFAKRIKEKQSE